MGVHDYVCFIGRNGQHVVNIRDESYWYDVSDNEDEKSDEDYDDEHINDIDDYGEYSHVTIVLVPKSVSVEEILSWKLEKFREYKVIQQEYSWDDWEFSELKGYGHLLKNYDSETKWWELSIWYHQKYDEYHLINFEPNAYKIFVSGECDPENIPNGYYRDILHNRDLTVLSDKTSMYKYISNCGDDNLAEYFGRTLPNFSPSNEYLTLYEDITKQANATYKLQNTPKDLDRSRLAILIKDNLMTDSEYYLTKAANIGIYESNYCISHVPGGDSKFVISVTPKLDIHFENHMLDGCILCGSNRLKSKYLCIGHRNDDISEQDIFQHLNKIDSESRRLAENIKMLNAQPTPKYLFVNFTERKVDYNLVLELF